MYFYSIAIKADPKNKPIWLNKGIFIFTIHKGNELFELKSYQIAIGYYD